MAPTNKKKTVEKGPPGRPKHEVWALGFRRVQKHCEKSNRTIDAAFCVICSKVLCNTASKRLSAHRRVCSLEQNGEIEPKEKEITKIMTADNTTTITFVDMDDVQYINDQSTDNITKTEYTFLDNPSESFEEIKLPTSLNVDHKFEMTLTKFFIGCNIPFTIADSSYFRKLCLTLNSTCKLVTSEQLSGPLLDLMYAKVHTDIQVSSSTVLLIDGWKNENTNTKNVTVMIRTESNETVFLNNYELTSSKDIVQELTDISKMAIMEAYEQFKTEVYAIIMGNSCSLIKMDNVSDVWQFTCNSHIVKLLIKEYISQDFMNTICKILKRLNIVFKDEDLEVKISSDMRWANTKCILQYCITNLGSIQEVLSSEDLIKLPKEYKCLFFDEEFIHKIETYIHFLDSINDLIMVCQMPSSSIADTTEQWLSIEISGDDSETAEKLLARRESVMKIQCLVANYLHPSYKGQKFPESYRVKAEEFLLSELDADGLNSLQLYMNDQGIFRVLNQKEGLTAQTYWNLARRTHNNLATLALRLLAIPASINSSCSQIFSTVKNTSLKPDKLKKLFAVYFHLKTQTSSLSLTNNTCNSISKRITDHNKIGCLEQNEESDLLEKSNSDFKEKELSKVVSSEDAATVTFIDIDGTQYLSTQSTSDQIAKNEYTFMDDSEETFEDLKISNVTGTVTVDSKLDTDVAKFFIGCNVPFSVADSPYFKKFCQALNSSYKATTSEQLSGPLLDLLYAKFYKDIQVSPTSVLLIDGCKSESTNTKSVTVMIKTQTNETIFLDNYELATSKDIAQELTEITKSCITDAYEQFKTTVYAAILGNSCSLMKMDSLSDLWQFPCNLHVIKLLIKEYITQDFMNILCKILKQLNMVFKDDDLETKISSDMRWTNVKCLLQYCITNLRSIQEILSSENLVRLPKDYKCLFFDDEFIHKIESYIIFLNSVNDLIMVCQMPKSNIADTTEQWLSIEIPTDDSEAAEKLLLRRENIVKIQCLVANYLHPVYKGKKFSENQMNTVEEFLLSELNADGLNSFLSYVNSEGIFGVLNQKAGLTPQTYWSFARRTHNNLATLALKLFTIPASINSNFSHIFSSVKNTSLKPDKMRKLFAVYYHLKEREERQEEECM